MVNKTGYNDDKKNVFNELNGIYIGSKGDKLTFLRDPKKLLKTYDNLIKSLGRLYGGTETKMSYTDRQELYAYISEVFIDLVKEYDMENDVDFPGYILMMMKIRIRGSYLEHKHRYDQHITPLKSETLTVEDLIDYNYDQPKLSYGQSKKKNSVISKIISMGDNNEIDEFTINTIRMIKNNSSHVEPLIEIVLMVGVEGYSLRESLEFIKKEYHLSNKEVNEYVEELKGYLE